MLKIALLSTLYLLIISLGCDCAQGGQDMKERHGQVVLITTSNQLKESQLLNVTFFGLDSRKISGR